jgi:U-box domain
MHVQVVMTNPALLPVDGQTCERAAIVEWLHQHGTSPLTRQPAEVESLMPNHALRSILDALAGK